RFLARVEKVIDIPWTMAVGRDFAFKGVTGDRPFGTSLVNWYLNHVHDAASTDRTVCRAFFDVANLLAAPTSLFAPRVIGKVARTRLTASRETRSAAAGHPAQPQRVGTAL